MAQAGSLDELYQSDSFRMDCMKVLPCTKHYVHDWTECPFAHPHEKARRRDPRRHNYTGIACPSMRQDGACSLADNCPYAHNVFEYWLHPTRYRTQLCNDGTACKRKLCFFAHGVKELRTPDAKPFVPAEAVLAAAAAAAAGGSQTDVLAAAAASPRQPSEDTSLPSPSQVQAQSQSQRSTDSAQASQEHPLIELMTRLVARGKVTPERSAAILQQVLSPDALHDLRNASGSLSSPTTAHSDSPERVCNSDPLNWINPSSPLQHMGEDALLPVRHSVDTALLPSLLPGPVAVAPPDYAALGAAMEQGPSVAEMRLALLQGALQEAQARSSLGLPASTAAELLGQGNSTRSSFDVARASFDGSQQHGGGGGLPPSPRSSWGGSYTGIVQHQLMMGALQQQEQAHALALATAASSGGFWGGPSTERLSLDSQLSQLSLDARTYHHDRASMDSRMSLGARPSMDGGPMSPLSMRVSQDMHRMSLEETAASFNAFSSGFYAPASRFEDRQ